MPTTLLWRWLLGIGEVTVGQPLPLIRSCSARAKVG
jgi:hypothetical protein